MCPVNRSSIYLIDGYIYSMLSLFSTINNYMIFVCNYFARLFHRVSSSPITSHQLRLSYLVSYFTFTTSFRVRIFHVPIDFVLIGNFRFNLLLLLKVVVLCVFIKIYILSRPLFDLAHSSCNIPMVFTVVLIPGLDRSVMKCLIFVAVICLVILL